MTINGWIPFFYIQYRNVCLYNVEFFEMTTIIIKHCLVSIFNFEDNKVKNDLLKYVIAFPYSC